MGLQNYQVINGKIREQFEGLKRNNPEALKKRLNLSWSNWGFGIESLADSAKRLANAGVEYIELHGNHYGDDLGYEPEETLRILGDNNIKVAGICGMFSKDNDLSSNSGIQRQNAVDYIRRELDFASAVGAGYMLIVPGAVGRPGAYDDSEFQRSVETVSIVADEFAERKIRGAVEPIRAAEVSLVHTIADAKRYIEQVNHPGIQHINGDVYHMQVEERHIGQALIDAGSMLTNLHMADSNRCALGDGSLDIDTIIMALYVIGYNNDRCFCTPEPLGPGGDPYPAMFGRPEKKLLDKLVNDSVSYFREREKVLLQS
ncbi:MAG: sugar phosphate isomerase/epimerase family protein [Planctomycetota bacterium]